MKRWEYFGQTAAIIMIVLCLLGPHVYAVLPCDFNNDGKCDVADLNALLSDGIATNDPTFDLDGNGTVDLGDREEWLYLAGNELGVELVGGDTNLDGAVDRVDLNALGLNWQGSGKLWHQGDFDGDGQVNASDLMQLGINWQHGTFQRSVTVPEPGGLVLFGLAACVVVWIVASKGYWSG